MDYLILTLATWRLASLLASEAGPWDVLSRLRHRLGVRYDDDGMPHARNVIGQAVICPWCSSVWIGLAWTGLWLAFGQVAIYLALPLALSAGSILIHELGTN